MPSEAVLREAAAVLDRRFGLDALWVFGSTARGEARAGSDVDLAALFRALVNAGPTSSSVLRAPRSSCDACGAWPPST